MNRMFIGQINLSTLRKCRLLLCAGRSPVRPMPLRVEVKQSRRVSEMTIAHYDRMAEAYWEGTRDHDVNQNYTALLDAIENDPPYSILDLGCGPGRDLRHFRSLGHDAVGLDGSKEFMAMARSYSGCEVLHQDFLAMALPESRFDGVFANASLFHVPSRELPRVLLDYLPCFRSSCATRGRRGGSCKARKTTGRLQ